jgi:hypothetical protein
VRITLFTVKVCTSIPKPFPEELRRDVVAVARKREAPLTQILKDFRDLRADPARPA